ncbi:uncharacterized protein LOC114527537 isoform X1 [Dendronephthya gigantea]|uniref:uncharacterized protein LOC114527007 n=1 Tax=Dendronephthya gigantea TaxID=151771 RepID=UPI00106C5ECF|nr:uncharacterized protein LOC114527007 [Dendronephthya gigantea]XP_028405025.1 uncharacterized protein LOC114527537 isoform X1 [Dendronephthya gigantea]
MDIDNDSTEGVENIQNVNAFNDQMPLYPDDYYEKKTRCKKIIFFGIVGIMVAITIIISLSRGASTHVSYVLLGFSIFCITLVEIALWWLHRGKQLDNEKEWFIYFVGVCIIIEAIFTDVLLFDKSG